MMNHPQNNMDYVKGNFEIVPNINLIPKMLNSTVKVYIAICKYANKKGQCYPSHTTIAEWCGLSRRQVVNSIKELQELKVITVVPREREDGGYTSNLYQIQQPRASEPQFTPPSEPQCTQTILNINHIKKAGINNIKNILENRYNRDITNGI